MCYSFSTIEFNKICLYKKYKKLFGYNDIKGIGHQCKIITLPL